MPSSSSYKTSYSSCRSNDYYDYVYRPSIIGPTSPPSPLKYTNYSSSKYGVYRSRLPNTAIGSNSTSKSSYSYILPRYSPPRTTLKTTKYGQDEHSNANQEQKDLG